MPNYYRDGMYAPGYAAPDPDQDRQAGVADPYGAYYFSLELTVQGGSAIEVAHFMECSGLKSSCAVYEIDEGGLNGRSHKRPGQSKWENIQFRYASSASTALLEWRDKFLTDQFDNRKKYSGSIALKNNAGEVVRRYHFKNAWPVAWEGPTLNAGSSELAVELLEIAHDGLSLHVQKETK